MPSPPIFPEQFSLKNHPEYDEAWLKSVIREKPSILKLGDDVEVVGIERRQPGGGRLDLLLYDQDQGKRYEVELQLGSVDESHIIRCIKYWDLERKAYRQYEHVAVIVAEEITQRFLNVIQLFNNSIPLIALKLVASRIGNEVSLQFIKILDEITPGEDDVGENQAPGSYDEAYWIDKSNPETVGVVNRCFDLIRPLSDTLALNYNMYFIGIRDGLRSNNFVEFRPRKSWVNVSLRTDDTDGLSKQLGEHGFLPRVNPRSARVDFKMQRGDEVTHRDVLSEIFRKSYKLTK